LERVEKSSVKLRHVCVSFVLGAQRDVERDIIGEAQRQQRDVQSVLRNRVHINRVASNRFRILCQRNSNDSEKQKPIQNVIRSKKTQNTNILCQMTKKSNAKGGDDSTKPKQQQQKANNQQRQNQEQLRKRNVKQQADDSGVDADNVRSTADNNSNHQKKSTTKTSKQQQQQQSSTTSSTSPSSSIDNSNASDTA
jgi:hypothetical protein